VYLCQVALQFLMFSFSLPYFFFFFSLFSPLFLFFFPSSQLPLLHLLSTFFAFSFFVASFHF